MNYVLDHFIASTKGAVTKNIDNYSLPLAFRGILKKKFVEECRQSNRDFYYIDTGYFGNYKSVGNPCGYKKWHRIVKNDLQHFEINYNLTRQRLDKLEKSDPRLVWTGWKKTGSDILLVVPSEKPCKFYNIDKHHWLTSIIEEIKKYTDRRIVIREKSTRSNRLENSIYDALDNNIFATVTYNSIAAVESVAYGIPAFVLAPSAAGKVSCTNLVQIESPYYPDIDIIEHWKRTLSSKQFTDNEISAGVAWSMLNGKY